MRKILTELQKLKDSSGEERPLDPTYNRVLDNIYHQPKNCKELALTVLSWLVKAQRTLTVAEIREAVSAELDRYELDGWDLPDETTLLDVCASLITIDKNTKTVRLAHYTVQEYLLRNRIPSDADFRVTTACITYLSFDIFSQTASKNSLGARLKLHPLLSYAANQLNVHLRACDEALTVDLLIVFLEKPGNIGTYTQAMERCKNTCNEPRCYLGCWNGCQRLWPLHIAAILGHSLVLWRLIEKGADISAQDGGGRTALHLAAFAGHEKVV